MDNTKTTIKIELIKWLEEQGEASKSKIEDYIREKLGTNGDTTSRRLRELVSAGIVSKTQKEYQGKKYFSYRVAEPPKVRCLKCNDSGIRPSKNYFGTMEVCECGQVERLPGGGLRVDMGKTPDWFQRDYKKFVNYIETDDGEERVQQSETLDL